MSVAIREKPPYRVSSMTEIAEVPWNGLTVVSTFSGGGGSSLGYRMAGYRVAWANEIVPEAAETYRVNHPGCILNTSDIRTIRAADIRATIGNIEVDVFDGSPPCQSFSTAGDREKGWGKERARDGVAPQRLDDLFFEYARLVAELQPRVFIAENVSGLIKGTAKGYFKMILAALKNCGYRVEARLLDAQWLGVPQARQRLFFIGVRNDLGCVPAFPMPLGYRYTVRDALPWIDRAAAQPHGPNSWQNDSLAADAVAPTVPTSPNGASYYHHEIEGANGFNGHAGSSADLPAATIQAGRTLDVVGIESNSSFEQTWLPPDQPVSTITASKHTEVRIAIEDEHPYEKRKFTILEVKRLCGFPDDYVLTGTFAQQWARLGNAVPPVMMMHVARALEKVLQ